MAKLPVNTKSSKRPRFHYAIESEVDRTVREQNRFLDHCKDKRVELTLFSTTGASFNGIVHDFDRETILFGGSGKSATPRLISKQFVAMIIPREAINLFLEYKGLGTARSKNRKQRFIDAVQKMGVSTEQLPSVTESTAEGSGDSRVDSESTGLSHPATAEKGGAVVTRKAQRQRVLQPPTDES